MVGEINYSCLRYRSLNEMTSRTLPLEVGKLLLSIGNYSEILQVRVLQLDKFDRAVLEIGSANGVIGASEILDEMDKSQIEVELMTYDYPLYPEDTADMRANIS